jgi:hypothetical protein
MLLLLSIWKQIMWRWDRLQWHNVHVKFRDHWWTDSKVDSGGFTDWHCLHRNTILQSSCPFRERMDSKEYVKSNWKNINRICLVNSRSIINTCLVIPYYDAGCTCSIEKFGAVYKGLLSNRQFRLLQLFTFHCIKDTVCEYKSYIRIYLQVHINVVYNRIL